METCEPREVLKQEQYWIDLICPEYNLSPTAGSTLGMPVSIEARAKLKAAHLGKTLSLETRMLMSETREGLYNYLFGQTWSEELRLNFLQ